jgi:hypothetical protein
MAALTRSDLEDPLGFLGEAETVSGPDLFPGLDTRDARWRKKP